MIKILTKSRRAGTIKAVQARLYFITQGKTDVNGNFGKIDLSPEELSNAPEYSLIRPFSLEAIFKPEVSMQHLCGLVRRCVDDYQMIEAGDKIAVGLSGGKDSLALLALLHGLMQYYPKPYTLEAITVDMGRVSFDSEKIPVAGPGREVVNEEFEIGGKKYKYCCATVGNPHCVLPMGEVSEKLAREIGPVIENMTSLFPNRTNVQLLQVLDRNNIKIEIWERGAGYTLASGSSSSAAASVAHRLGLCDGDITVHMEGGDLSIKISPDYSITMSGPATKVGVYEMSPSVLSQNVPIKM